jgi:hypothetical protein
MDPEQTMAMIGRGQCPVCAKQMGHRQPRQTLLHHLRRLKDPEHTAWRCRWYAVYFPWGKPAVPPAHEEEYKQRVVQELVRTYGEGMTQAIGRRIISSLS